MQEELKPCPFCGGKAEIEQQGTGRVSNIYCCTDCGCRLETGETWQTPMAWNARATPTFTQEDVERVAVAINQARILRPTPQELAKAALNAVGRVE